MLAQRPTALPANTGKAEISVAATGHEAVAAAAPEIEKTRPARAVSALVETPTPTNASPLLGVPIISDVGAAPIQPPLAQTPRLTPTAVALAPMVAARITQPLMALPAQPQTEQNVKISSVGSVAASPPAPSDSPATVTNNPPVVSAPATTAEPHRPPEAVVVDVIDEPPPRRALTLGLPADLPVGAVLTIDPQRAPAAMRARPETAMNPAVATRLRDHVASHQTQRPPARRPGRDPFANDFLETGWRQIHAQPGDGIFAADGRLVVWGQAGLSTSMDQGASWTQPVPLWSNGGAVPVAEAIIVGGKTWVRGMDGSLRVMGEANARNRLLRVQAVSRLAPCSGDVFAVENGGSEVCLIARGMIVQRTPGRLVMTLAAGAVADDGITARWLMPSGVVPIDRPSESLGEPPIAVGPAGMTSYSTTGLDWKIRDGAAHGSGQVQVTVRALGAGEGPGGIGQVGLIDDPHRGQVVIGVTGRGEITGMDATAGLPPGTTAIASCGRDRLNGARIRLVAVGAGGCWIYRCR